MTDYASIKIKSKTKSSADRLMKKFEMNGLEFYDSVMEYFEVTGVNPKDQVILSPAEELKKFRDTIVSFMRKQENDFIKPTFGKMDTLIARFTDYINEEAPKKGETPGQNKTKSLALSGDKDKEEKRVATVIEAVKIDENSDLYKELQEKLIKSEMKLNTTKKYLENILSHTENKATHFERKPVIELSMGEINDYKKYLKTL
jgi:signal recognition particle GTPase